MTQETTEFPPEEVPPGVLIPCEIDSIRDSDDNDYLSDNEVPELYSYSEHQLTVLALAENVSPGSEYIVSFRDGSEIIPMTCEYEGDPNPDDGGPGVPAVFTCDLTHSEVSTEDLMAATASSLPRLPATPANQQLPCFIDKITVQGHTPNLLLEPNLPDYYFRVAQNLTVVAFTMEPLNKAKKYRVSFHGFLACNNMNVKYIGSRQYAPAILTGSYPPASTLEDP